MGVFTQTNATIVCKDEVSAEKVFDALAHLRASATDDNFQFHVLERDNNQVFIEHSSNRSQNLEWQFEQVWEKIQEIDGVEHLSAPFMVEDNGMFFEKE